MSSRQLTWCLCLLTVVLLFSYRSTAAEELILEFDPDEEIRAEDLVAPPVTSSSEASFTERVQNRSAQFRQGYQQLFQLNDQEIAGFQAVLMPLQQDISNLDTQLQVLAAQIERTKQIDAVVQQKISGLEELDEKFRIQEQLLALEMKGVVKRFEKMTVLFFQVKRSFVMEDGRVNILNLFASAKSPSEVLFQDRLLQGIQQQLLQQMNLVSGHQFQLSVLRTELRDIQGQLQQYRERVQRSATVLAEQVAFQSKLLADKQYEQRFFQQSLEEALEEQRIIAERIQELATGVTPEVYAEFPKEQLIWPVAPLLGISAHFQDEAYHSRFGLDHNAVDIPTDQLTAVRAPLSGKVIKVHDGGATGYSYVQLAHRDGLSTVYGHIYESKVREGELVAQGDVIALSGGSIGTRGAGRLTTGPHLHFELLKDGEHVDPLLYLPKISSQTDL